MAYNPGRFRIRPMNDNGFVAYSGDLGILGNKLNDCLCPKCITEMKPYLDNLKIAISIKGVINTQDEYIGLIQLMLNTHCGFNYLLEEIDNDGNYVNIM